MYGNFVSEDGVLRKFESRVFSTVEEAVEESVDQIMEDGSIKKVAIFRHAGFVEV